MTARRTKLALGLFDAFLIPFCRLRLAGIRFKGLDPPIPADHSVIVAANHPSWWDGFLIRTLHRRIGGAAPLFTIMLEEMRRQNPILRPLGTIGIQPGNASSLKRATTLLEEARREGPVWVSIFPQGHLHPSWDHTADFEPGVEFFSRRLAPSVVLPVGIHLEVLADPKPFAFVSVGEPILTGGTTRLVQTIKEAVDAELGYIRLSILEHKERAPDHWQR